MKKILTTQKLVRSIENRIKKILKNRPLVCLTANNIYTAEILDEVCDIILVETLSEWFYMVKIQLKKFPLI